MADLTPALEKQSLRNDAISDTTVSVTEMPIETEVSKHPQVPVPSQRTTFDLIFGPWKLLVTSLWPDLRSLTWWQATFLLVFGCVSIFFSFFDINYYVYPDTRPSPNKVANDHLYGYTDRQRVFMSLSGAASFTGAVSVVFAAKGKYSNYSFGIINATLYGLFAWYYGYGGDAQMNVLFFNVMQLIGMYTWQRNLNADKTAIVRSLKWWHWIIAVVVAVGLSVAFYYEIPVFVEAISGADSYWYPGVNAPHILDSVANALSVVAQSLLLLRCWEQWIVWIIIDCIQISMFSGINTFPYDVNVLIMWSFFLVNALAGLVGWFRMWRQTVAAQAEVVAAAEASKQLELTGVQVNPLPAPIDGDYEPTSVPSKATASVDGTAGIISASAVTVAAAASAEPITI